jgi:hypothetical protein
VPSEANTDFALRIQTPVFSAATLVLAFTLVQADINFRYVDGLISTEAARIDQLDRLLTRYHAAEADEAKPYLLAYVNSIVRDEWPLMLKTGAPSEATRQAFAGISRRTLAIQPANSRQSLIFGEMLRSLDNIAESRATRLNTVNLGLPKIYWQVMLAVVALFLLITCVIAQTPFRVFVLAAQAAALGGLVGFVFLMDQPFKGETAVDTKPFAEALAHMKSRTD